MSFPDFVESQTLALNRIDVDVAKDQLQLRGKFPQGCKVQIEDTLLKVAYESDSLLLADLPSTGKGSAGHVFVTYIDKSTDTLTLSSWTLHFSNHTQTIHSWQETTDWTESVNWRADLGSLLDQRISDKVIKTGITKGKILSSGYEKFLYQGNTSIQVHGVADYQWRDTNASSVGIDGQVTITPSGLNVSLFKPTAEFDEVTSSGGQPIAHRTITWSPGLYGYAVPFRNDTFSVPKRSQNGQAFESNWSSSEEVSISFPPIFLPKAWVLRKGEESFAIRAFGGDHYIHATVTLPIASNFKIELYDLWGRLLTSRDGYLVGGSSKMKISIELLASGIYSLVLRSSRGIASTKLTILR